MEQLLEFAGNHLLLVSALVLTLGLLGAHTLLGGKDNIDPQQATLMMNHEGAVVVDVRPMADFGKGHIYPSHYNTVHKKAEVYCLKSAEKCGAFS